MSSLFAAASMPMMVKSEMDSSTADNRFVDGEDASEGSCGGSKCSRSLPVMGGRRGTFVPQGRKERPTCYLRGASEPSTTSNLHTFLQAPFPSFRNVFWRVASRFVLSH